MDYQRIIIVGNATRDAERRTSKSGEVDYTTFSVGVSDGRDRTTYFPITVFGRSVEAVATYVTKGMQVLVEGRVDVDENRRMSVIADRVVFGASARRDTTETDPAISDQAQ